MIEQALDVLKNGGIIIVVDDEDRENEGDFVCLAQYATPQNINFMATYGRGLICAPVSEAIAERLALHPMVTTNTDPHGTAFTESIDFETTTTGISAFERAETIQQLCNEHVKAHQFKRPGHVFPLRAKAGGVIERRGHTEAGIELAKLCNSTEAAVICEILNDDGTMARRPQLEQIANQHNLHIMTIEALVDYVQLARV
ncbi:3,4-dihydroxy-2-butanone-4-phosphate synthase [Caryophanon tenue]|uniref:3,4-dihydroxy-2-butanone 4-phosphate synthase n=1 Tax=Caryophanon tenue TaxID=33978 RepID=A0A1C0Y757_9BACL|nr:3,4-dihydroxy-2-butanone-4-phosphate synthase [Caryophanon tenue]OCS83019.1 3,4-dihydroxy-2-butanone-4-phosphate synthase [Caryophanon tenue]